jgi:uncharacterized protein
VTRPGFIPAVAALLRAAAARGRVRWLVPALAMTASGAFAAPRVLFFSKSSGFEHSVIKDPADPRTKRFRPSEGSAVPGLAFEVLRDLGREHRIDFVFSKDGSLFSPRYLAQFNAVVFYTTGDLTQRGVDGQPPMTPAGKEALLSAVRGGLGFVGIHSASDTFHSPGGEDEGPARFRDDGARTDPYIRMLGGEFILHGRQQVARLVVADRSFPGAWGFAGAVPFREEWYSLKDFAPDLHVILVQDTSGMKGFEYRRPAYPMTWAHLYGKGRVFYTSLGHRDDVWRSALFQNLIVGGLDWALRRVDADLTPNLKTAAPGANVLPKYVPRSEAR